MCCVLLIVACVLCVLCAVRSDQVLCDPTLGQMSCMPSPPPGMAHVEFSQHSNIEIKANSDTHRDFTGQFTGAGQFAGTAASTTLLWTITHAFFVFFSRMDTTTHARVGVICSTECPSSSDADWCLQSDVMPDSRLEAQGSLRAQTPRTELRAMAAGCRRQARWGLRRHNPSRWGLSPIYR